MPRDSCKFPGVETTQAALEPSARALTGYLQRVSRRVLWFKVARGSAFALGLGLLLLLLCSLLVGPSIGMLGAVLTWGSVVACVLLAAAVGLVTIVLCLYQQAVTGGAGDPSEWVVYTAIPLVGLTAGAAVFGVAAGILDKTA